MIRLLTRSLVLRWLLLGLLLAPVLLVTLVPSLTPRRFVAQYLGRQLDELPDSAVVPHVRQISELGMPGTRVLVGAMSHPREVVARAAGNALHAQLDEWEGLPIGESGPRIVVLADLLADTVDHCDPPARALAADLMARILRWPPQRGSSGTPDFIADCEHVVRATSGVVSTEAGSVEAKSATTAARASGDESSGATPMLARRQDAERLVDIPVDDLPGGDLPIEEVPISPLPPPLADPQSPRPLEGDEPRLMPSQLHQLPREIFPDDSLAPQPESIFPASPVPGPFQAEPDREVTDSQLNRATAIQSDLNLSDASDWDLLRRLTGTSALVQQAVEMELRKRGFGDKQFSMARQLRDPDPQVRRKLAESLSTAQTPPAPWLFWLSHDPEPMVRRLVVSLMATTQDPQLHARLGEMERLETDESVREQLSRLVERPVRRR